MGIPAAALVVGGLAVECVVGTAMAAALPAGAGWALSVVGTVVAAMSAEVEDQEVRPIQDSDYSTETSLRAGTLQQGENGAGGVGEAGRTTVVVRGQRTARHTHMAMWIDLPTGGALSTAVGMATAVADAATSTQIGVAVVVAVLHRHSLEVGVQPGGGAAGVGVVMAWGVQVGLGVVMDEGDRLAEAHRWQHGITPTPAVGNRLILVTGR